MNLLKILNKKEESTRDLFPYLGSEYNKGAFIGKCREEPVYLDLFGPNRANPHLGVIGVSGAGKTGFLRTLMKNEDKSSARFVITTKGFEFDDFDSSDIHINKDFVVNPFQIENNDTKGQVDLVTGILIEFGKLKHIPLDPFNVFEEEVIRDFIEEFIRNKKSIEVLTMSKLREELKLSCNALENKIDHQIKTFSHSYESSGKRPYEYYQNNPDQFKFTDLLKRIEIFQKTLKCISVLDSMGLLKHIDGPNTVNPLSKGVYIVDLSEIKDISENYFFITSFLLDYLEKDAIKRSGKTAIYIDSLPNLSREKEEFKDMLESKMIRGRAKNISYRLSGIDLPLKLLAHCYSVVGLGPIVHKTKNKVFGNASGSLEGLKPGEGCLRVGNNFFTFLK